MRLDKVNVDMYISQSKSEMLIIDSQEDQSQEDPQPQESDSIVQIDLNLDEEGKFGEFKVIETPKPDENRIQIPMGDLEDSLDEGKISIPLAGQASGKFTVEIFQILKSLATNLPLKIAKFCV